MRYFLVFTFLLGLGTTFGQKELKTCNQLPYAKVDQKAELTNDMAELIQEDLPEELKKGAFNVKYKCYVDCKGNLEKIRYQNGNISESNQNWLTSLMGKSEWKPGVTEDTYVTSLVFVAVYFENGQVKVVIL
ncbi:MAG: hypothetical protein HUJ25_13210 [Crocinitomicaceae bacterium]|nr:hypothetical protein [Crocinitomicaceae bacterium]